MKKAVEAVRRAAAGYEPAVVASIVGAVFALLVGVGLPQVTDLKDEVDAVLTFLAFIAPIVAGVYARSKVKPLKSLTQGTDGVYR